MRASEKLEPANILRIVARFLLIALLVVNIAFITRYITIEYQAYFHTDASVKNLLAREIYENRTYFPKDWNYVNGDLWVLFGQTYIIPLLPFFKNDFKLHAFSGLISAFFILYSTYLVTQLATKSIWTRLSSVTVVAAGISGLLAENFYGQVSYGYVYYFSCFIIYSAWKYISHEKSNRNLWIWGGVVFLLFFLTFLGNPQRAAPSFALPVIGSVVVGMLLAEYRHHTSLSNIEVMPAVGRARQLSLIGIIGIGAVLGSFSHLLVIENVNDIRGVAHAVWLSYPRMAENFVLVISQILSVFGALPQAGEMVFDSFGIYNAVRLFGGIILIGLIPVVLFQGVRDQNPSRAFFHTTVSLIISIFIFLQVTTSVADMKDPIQSARYLVPGLILCLVALITQTTRIIQPFLRILSIVVIVLLASSGYRALLGSGMSNSIDHDFSSQVREDRKLLVKFLKANGLKYGYATYWNSGVYSVLSGEDTRIRQVNFSYGIPHPMRHLSSDAWYRPPAWTGPSFIMMTEQESPQLDLDELARYGLKPSKRLEFQSSRAITSPSGNSTNTEFKSVALSEKWIIYVFDKNISENLPEWDLTYANPSRFPVGRLTPHVIGTYSEKSSRPSLEANASEHGVLYFGPYITALAGEYQVEFDLEMADFDGDGAVTLDIVSDKGRNIHASAKLSGKKYSHYELPFSLQTKVEDLEFRVFTTGGVELKVYSTKITRANPNKQATKQ